MGNLTHATPGEARPAPPAQGLLWPMTAKLVLADAHGGEAPKCVGPDPSFGPPAESCRSGGVRPATMN